MIPNIEKTTQINEKFNGVTRSDSGVVLGQRVYLSAYGRWGNIERRYLTSEGETYRVRLSANWQRPRETVLVSFGEWEAG